MVCRYNLGPVGSHEFQVSLHTEELCYLVYSFYSSQLSTVHRSTVVTSRVSEFSGRSMYVLRNIVFFLFLDQGYCYDGNKLISLSVYMLCL